MSGCVKEASARRSRRPVVYQFVVLICHRLAARCSSKPLAFPTSPSAVIYDTNIALDALARAAAAPPAAAAPCRRLLLPLPGPPS